MTTLRDTRAGRFVRRHDRLHRFLHATWCQAVGPFDTKRRATSGGTAAVISHGGSTNKTSSTSLGGPQPTSRPVTLEIFDYNGVRQVKMSFPDEVSEAEWLGQHYLVTSTASIATGTYDIYDTATSTLLQYGYVKGLAPPGSNQLAPVPVGQTVQASPTVLAADPTGLGGAGQVPAAGSLGGNAANAAALQAQGITFWYYQSPSHPGQTFQVQVNNGTPSPYALSTLPPDAVRVS